MSARLPWLGALLLLVACNIPPDRLGRIDLPVDDASTRSLEQTSLAEHASAAPRSIEEGLEEFRRRVAVREDGTPAEPGRPTPLSVSEMRALVLDNNLDLDVALFGPEIAREEITAEEGRFDALIGARFKYRRYETPKLDGPLVELSGSREALDDEVVKLTEVEQIREEIDAALGIRVPLPSGGEVALEQVLDSKRIVDPDHYDQYLAAMRFSFSQPLMRGAGPDANFARIRLARVNRRITQVRTKLAALRILVDAEKAYWRLYAARKFFDVRVEQYRLAAEGLEMVRRRVAEGITPEVETVRAEVGVYRSLEKLIVAETDWRLRQRDLKRYLASEGFPLDGEETIEVATDPHLAGLEVDAEALVEQAIRTRPELIEAELRIVRDGVDIAYRQNQVLPIVNLDFQYGVLDRDDSFGSAWASQFGFEHSDFSVGLSFEVPLTNQTPRAELRRAMLSRSLQMASREARELVVREEVLDMIDVMDQNWQRIIAARQNVIVAGVNYDAESRQFREGLRTMREVLEALSDLGEARIREVRAIVEYQVAQIDLAFASGTLLGYARVGLESLRLP